MTEGDTLAVGERVRERFWVTDGDGDADSGSVGKTMGVRSSVTDADGDGEPEALSDGEAVGVKKDVTEGLAEAVGDGLRVGDAVGLRFLVTDAVGVTDGDGVGVIDRDGVLDILTVRVEVAVGVWGIRINGESNPINMSVLMIFVSGSYEIMSTKTVCPGNDPVYVIMEPLCTARRGKRNITW